LRLRVLPACAALSAANRAGLECKLENIPKRHRSQHVPRCVTDLKLLNAVRLVRLELLGQELTGRSQSLGSRSVKIRPLAPLSVFKQPNTVARVDEKTWHIT